MQYTYEVTQDGNIKRTDENGNVCFIPPDPSNKDYQDYQEYLETNP